MKKFNRVSADIDLDAIIHNMKIFEGLVDDGTMFLPVIKANAYGHGSDIIGKVLEKDERIWGFAVAAAEEGAELKKAGIKKPVMLLGGAFPDSYDILLKYDLRAVVFDLDQALSLNETAEKCDLKAKIHIALDTGMNRIGFEVSEEAADTVRKISSLSNIEIEGLFTHFARADEEDKTKAGEQLSLYKKFVQMLEERDVHIKIKHTANSASIIDLKETHFDMVRPGIILYGLEPSEYMGKVIKERGIDIRPVMSLRSHIIYIKDVFPGEEISYGGTYKASEKRIVATIPVGYADGYPRTLSNKGYVLIKGKKAPILGRVCMDQFMVDVTDIPDAGIGDEVVLIGKQGDESITMERFAELSGRFNYEVPCLITRRVPRNYFMNGAKCAQVDYLA